MQRLRQQATRSRGPSQDLMSKWTHATARDSSDTKCVCVAVCPLTASCPVIQGVTQQKSQNSSVTPPSQEKD